MKAIDVIELFQNSIVLKNTTKSATSSLVSVAKKLPTMRTLNLFERRQILFGPALIFIIPPDFFHQFGGRIFSGDLILGLSFP